MTEGTLSFVALGRPGYGQLVMARIGLEAPLWLLIAHDTPE